MKLQSPLFAMAMALATMAAACGSTTSSNPGTGGSQSGGSGSGGATGTGGKSGTGGSPQGTGGKAAGGQAGTTSGGGGAATCDPGSSVTPCGGDVTGTWTATPTCLKVGGNVDMSGFGIGCTSAPVTGTLQVQGTWTAADGKYTDKTTTTGTETITLPAACLDVSGTTTTCERVGGVISAFGYESVTCTNATGGGCNCTATINQTGWPGIVSVNVAGSGKYTTASNTITVDEEGKFAYCVSGNKMTWTPQAGTTTITGSVVFTKSGGGGAGGSVGGAGGAAGGGGNGTGGKSTAGGAGGTSVRDGGSDTPPAANGGSGGGGVGAGGSGGGNSPEGPCDIYGTANVPCVAAFSTTRSLYSKYTGPLYQLRKGGGSKNTGTGGTTQDIGSKDGVADGAAHEAFCGSDSCTYAIIYDQSGKKNDLKVAPAGCYTGTASEADYESSATHSLTLGGKKVYSLYMVAHEGYRNNKTSGVPTGDVGQGMYEVADGKRIGAACCFDFGNAAPNNCNGGTMTALFFGTGYWGKGAGNGPWFLADLEGGVWAGGTGASNAVNSKNPSMAVPYAFGVLKSGPGNYAILAADATTGSLTSAYDGAQPKKLINQGAIVLGIGGDNSNSSLGTFFEGVITNGRPTDDTDAAVLKNIQAAGYGK